jgi:hypothetical protein
MTSLSPIITCLVLLNRNLRARHYTNDGACRTPCGSGCRGGRVEQLVLVGNTWWLSAEMGLHWDVTVTSVMLLWRCVCVSVWVCVCVVCVSVCMEWCVCVCVWFVLRPFDGGAVAPPNSVNTVFVTLHWQVTTRMRRTYYNKDGYLKYNEMWGAFCIFWDTMKKLKIPKKVTW